MSFNAKIYADTRAMSREEWLEALNYRMVI